LAWAGKNTAHAADIGIAGLFIVGIAALVIDHDRFAACLAGMLMFRCSDDEDACTQARSAYGENSLEYQSCLRSNRSGGGLRSGGGSFGGFSSGGGHK